MTSPIFLLSWNVLDLYSIPTKIHCCQTPNGRVKLGGLPPSPSFKWTTRTPIKIGLRKHWSRSNMSIGANGETRTLKPLGYKPSALATELYIPKAILGRSWVYPVGVYTTHQLDKLNSFPAIAFGLYSSMARALVSWPRGWEFESHHWHPHCKFFYWYQEFLCPVESLYSDKKSTTVEKW